MKMSDFQPIESLKIPGVGDVECSGLVLVVGPNSSGKSQLLRDIYKRIAGEPRETVVADEIKIKKPHYESFVDVLEKEGFVQKIINDDGNVVLRPKGTYGTGEAASDIDANQALHLYGVHQDSEDFAKRRRSEFLSYFGRFLVTQLFLERRLVSLSSAGIIDFINQAPQHDLHALHLNYEAGKSLDEETRASFSKAVWSDTSRGSAISLKVSSASRIPSAEDRLDPFKMSKYRQIEDEGDGFKSYVATCVSLLLGRRPVCLIDEPELCLHPPQAYSLGKFIGRTASSSAAVTFVATHSSHILRGVISNGSDMQIVRMTRSGDGFEAHRVPSETLKAALTKPTVRAESILDGIFSEAVVVVEADTDRSVYQAAWESVSSEYNRDLHFSAVGGVGGIADTVALYKALRIPVAVIADIDLILNLGMIKSVVVRLSGEELWKSISSDIENIGADIKMIAPTISGGDVEKCLNDLLSHSMDWGKGDDSEIASGLRRLAKKLDRMAVVKEGGVRSLSPDARHRVDALMKTLQSIGLFIVPNGELESWLECENIVASRDKKWAWANEASLKLRTGKPKGGDIWDFVRSIADKVFSSVPRVSDRGY